MWSELRGPALAAGIPDAHVVVVHVEAKESETDDRRRLPLDVRTVHGARAQLGDVPGMSGRQESEDMAAVFRVRALSRPSSELNVLGVPRPLPAHSGRLEVHLAKKPKRVD